MATGKSNGASTSARRKAPPASGVAKAAGEHRHEHPQLPLTVSRPELLVDGSDQLYRQLVHSLLSLAGLHEAIRDGIAAHLDLGGVQHTILQSIKYLGATGPVSVRDIADHLGLSGSFITMETAKLQDLGFVEKKQSTTDRRKVSLSLTKKGIALFERIAPLQQTVGDVQFGCLTAAQFRDLVPIVARLVETSREALFVLHYLEHSDSAYRDLSTNIETIRKRLKQRAGRQR